MALVLLLLLLPRGGKPEAAETPAETTVPTEAPTPDPVAEVTPTPEPRQPYDGSPYTAERVREGAEKAASDPELNYSLTNADGAELELPKGKEFIDYPMQMKVFAGEGIYFDLLPTPNAVQEALGHMYSGDEVWVVAIRVHETEKDEDGAPQIYYLAVAEDGRAGWNKKEAFQVTGIEYCEDELGEWLPATCVRPETCKNCGATRGEIGDHIWKAATCQRPETCEICGHTRGGLGGHDWAEATCTEPKKCRICGTTEGEALDHNWVITNCAVPATCSRCGAVSRFVSMHIFAEATCTEPKTCTVCGVTEGEALGHDYDEYLSCKRCGYSPSVHYSVPDPAERIWMQRDSDM